MSFLAKVKAGISKVVYHYCGSIRNAVQILKEDQFKLTFVSGSDDVNLPKNKFYYLSTTRSPIGSYHVDDSSGVLLKLDGQKLQQNYIGNPVDYWGREFRKVAPSKNEMEDRIWSDKPVIKPATKYIDEIHIYNIANDPKYVRDLLIQAKRKNIPAFVYTDHQAAKVLDKRKAVPIKDLDLKVEPSKLWPDLSWIKTDSMAAWVELYEKDKKEHLSERALTILGKYGFHEFSQLKADIHNHKRGAKGLHKFVDILKREKWTPKDFYEHVREKWERIKYN